MPALSYWGMLPANRLFVYRLRHHYYWNSLLLDCPLGQVGLAFASISVRLELAVYMVL